MTSIEEESEKGRGDLFAVEGFQAVEPTVASAVVDEEEAVFEPPRR